MSTKSTNKFVKLKSGRHALISEDGEVLRIYKSHKKVQKTRHRVLHKREKPEHEPFSTPFGIYDTQLEYDLAKAIDACHEDACGCVNGDYVGDSTHEPDFIDLLTDERFMDPDDY